MKDQANDARRAFLRRSWELRETGDLLQIWHEENLDEYQEEVFETIEEILVARLGALPTEEVQPLVEDLLLELPTQKPETPKPTSRTRATTRAREHLDQAESYREAGKLDQALRACDLAIQIAPELAEGHNGRGVIYDEMDQFEHALAAYREAVQLDPEYEEAWNNLKSVEEYLGEEFQQSTGKQHLDQALVYVNNDEPERALEECALAKQTLPGLAVAHNALGLILEELEQLEPAIEAYLEAVRLNPRFYIARANLRNARLKYEEEQYRQPPQEMVEVEGEGAGWPAGEAELGATLAEIEESRIFERASPAPGWVYLDEKAFLLSGWPGHRKRPERSGYDYVDLASEEGHIGGVITHQLLTGKFRTHNPIYLFGMIIFGLLLGCLPLVFTVALLVSGDLAWIAILLVLSPYWVVGGALLANVVLSIFAEETEVENPYGQTFF